MVLLMMASDLTIVLTVLVRVIQAHDPTGRIGWSISRMKGSSCIVILIIFRNARLSLVTTSVFINVQYVVVVKLSYLT